MHALCTAIKSCKSALPDMDGARITTDPPTKINGHVWIDLRYRARSTIHLFSLGCSENNQTGLPIPGYAKILRHSATPIGDGVKLAKYLGYSGKETVTINIQDLTSSMLQRIPYNDENKNAPPRISGKDSGERQDETLCNNDDAVLFSFPSPVSRPNGRP